jgi:hypothetical protein
MNCEERENYIQNIILDIKEMFDCSQEESEKILEEILDMIPPDNNCV